jgi:hypothetical protein
MSAIDNGSTERPGFETESAESEGVTVGCLTHPMDASEDFAELVKKLTKSNWFCDVAEA